MTAEPAAQIAATFVVEYPCERRCQVEVDLGDARTRFTYGQMLDSATVAHRVAHRSQERVFTGRPGVTVRAGAL